MPMAIPIQNLDPDKICFFDLPPELRNMIYDLHFANRTRPAQHISDYSDFEDDKRDVDSDDEMADEIMEEQADEDENGSEPSDEDIELEHDETNEAEETGEERYDSGDESWDIIQTAPVGTARWRPDLNRYTFAVAYSPYRDEIVIDYQGNLHGKLPRLSRTSRQVLAETWQYTYDSDYKFLVYLHRDYARHLFELVGVCRLLVDVCGLVITEANTILVIQNHISVKAPTQGPHTDQKDNTIWWYHKHWYADYPLFDTNLETTWWQPPTLTGGKSWGHKHLYPVQQRPADHYRKCFGIVRYLRLLEAHESPSSKILAAKLVNDHDEMRDRHRHSRLGGGTRREGPWVPNTNLASESDIELIAKIMRAVADIQVFGGQGVDRPTNRHAEELARKIYWKVGNALGKLVWRREFDALEKRHLEISLPLCQDEIGRRAS